MNISFDKIYCISYLERMERREFMEYQFKELGIFDKVEFVNALDLSKILPEKILDDVNKNVSLFPIFSCALSHYTCVKSAKLFGYKKILILEDDMCFLKNKETLELFFNNLPDDWDYIKYMYVWYFNTIKLNENILYYPLNSGMFGDNNTNAGIYALNERAIDLYLSICEKNKLNTSDYIKFFFNSFKNSPLKSYIPSKLICTQYLYLIDENKYKPGNVKQFGHPMFDFNSNDFYLPKTKLKSILNNNR